MTAHSFGITLDRALRVGFLQVADPGASGTIGWDNKGKAICIVSTAAAESRALPAASSKAPGTELLVIFQTDGGDLTLTGAQASVVLANAGDMVRFVVSKTAAGTNVWRVLNNSAIFGVQLVDIPLTSFRVWDAAASNLPSEAAADDSDDFGFRTPTVGTTAEALVMKATTATTAPKAIVPAVVPANYVAGSPLSIVIPFVREDAATTSASLDVVAYRSAAPTVDINTTSAVDINSAASGTATFVLDPTSIVPGENILIELVGAIVDGTTSLFSFPRVSWSYTV